MPVLKHTLDGPTWYSLLQGPTGPEGLPGPIGLPRELSYGRNRVINADFLVNQRGFTNYVSNTTQPYTVDHWRSVFNGSGAATHSIVTATPGELPESAAYYFRIATSGQAIAADRATLFQQIEDARTLTGKFATVSFWVRAASGTPYVAVELRQSLNGGGAGTTTQSKKFMINTTWTRYAVTIYVPVLTLTPADATDHLQLLLWVTSGADYNLRNDNIPLQNNTFDFWGVQVEEGEVATAFEQKTYAQTLRDCQRFFQRWKQPPVRGAMNSATYCTRMAMPLPVPMRVTPGVSMAGTMYVYDGAVGAGFTAVQDNYTTTSVLEFQVTGIGMTSAAGRPVLVYQENAGAGYLDLSAEY